MNVVAVLVRVLELVGEEVGGAEVCANTVETTLSYQQRGIMVVLTSR